jgi:hypothetical protein
MRIGVEGPQVAARCPQRGIRKRGPILRPASNRFGSSVRVCGRPQSRIGICYRSLGAHGREAVRRQRRKNQFFPEIKAQDGAAASAPGGKTCRPFSAVAEIDIRFRSKPCDQPGAGREGFPYCRARGSYVDLEDKGFIRGGTSGDSNGFLSQQDAGGRKGEERQSQEKASFLVDHSSKYHYPGIVNVFSWPLHHVLAND